MPPGSFEISTLLTKTLPVNQTLVIDLSTSFSTVAWNNDIQIRQIEKGQCPTLNLVRFWIDEARQTAYAYGGGYSSWQAVAGRPTIPLEKLWAFTANNSGGLWQQIDQSSDSVFGTLTRPTEGSFAFGAIGGFGLGGYKGSLSSQKTSHLSSYIASPGLQFYNFTSGSWYNNSAIGYTSNGASIWAGSMYVPTWGPAGVLLVFGGQAVPDLALFKDGDAYLSMSNITLFDPLTQSWHYQMSTGDIPTQRDRFCVVGASGGDNTTYGRFLSRRGW